MAGWRLPAELVLWITQLSQMLHRRLAWRLLPLPGAPPITRFSVWVASLDCTIDISKARRELGYAPVKTREQGLEELRAAGAQAAPASG